MRGVMSVFVLVCLMTSPAPAQTTAGGAVSGVARDEQGAAVPGAIVAAVSDTAPGVHRTVTDRSGHYRLADLPAGLSS